MIRWWINIRMLKRRLALFALLRSFFFADRFAPLAPDVCSADWTMRRSSPFSSYLQCLLQPPSSCTLQWINLPRLIAATGRHCVCIYLCVCMYVCLRLYWLLASAKLRHATHRITHGLLFTRRLPPLPITPATKPINQFGGGLIPFGWLLRFWLAASLKADDEVVKREKRKRENNQGQGGLPALASQASLNFALPLVLVNLVVIRSLTFHSLLQCLVLLKLRQQQYLVHWNLFVVTDKNEQYTVISFCFLMFIDLTDILQ